MDASGGRAAWGREAGPVGRPDGPAGQLCLTGVNTGDRICRMQQTTPSQQTHRVSGPICRIAELACADEPGSRLGASALSVADPGRLSNQRVVDPAEPRKPRSSNQARHRRVPS